jgi:hypothetical protein
VLKIKKILNKSFVGSRGGFSKEPLAAGGIFVRASIIKSQNEPYISK